jgi:hypothetical protein
MPKHKNSILDHKLISNSYFYPHYAKLIKSTRETKIFADFSVDFEIVLQLK